MYLYSSLVSKVTGYVLDDQGLIHSRGRDYSFAAISRLVLGPNHSLIQLLLLALPLRVKQLEHESDHSPPSSAKFKMCEALSPFPPLSS